jgi:hypothetical protein
MRIRTGSAGGHPLAACRPNSSVSWRLRPIIFDPHTIHTLPLMQMRHLAAAKCPEFCVQSAGSLNFVPKQPNDGRPVFYWADRLPRLIGCCRLSNCITHLKKQHKNISFIAATLQRLMSQYSPAQSLNFSLYFRLIKVKLRLIGVITDAFN